MADNHRQLEHIEAIEKRLWSAADTLRANSITRYGLSVDAVTSALFPVPPLEEQHAIAKYLRRETIKTNSLIAGIREYLASSSIFAKLVKILVEYRAALVSATVTDKIDVRPVNL